LPVGRCPDRVAVRIERPDGGEAAALEVGRIVVASPFISPGYWRQPALNAAAFSQDVARPGWRIYRTEDMGSFGADQELYFHGREGTRVKIRGQSVDLAEIESAVRRCEDVRDVAVIASSRENGPEADLLVAYVVMAGPAGRDAKSFRRRLAEFLPHYMVPAAYVFPEALPMTATGKVDRRQLQKQPLLEALPTREDAPPADELEQGIAGIFSAILDRPTVGRLDDFYLLGGDSLSSVELQVSLSELTGSHITLKEILKDPTVAGLAATLRQTDPAAISATPANALLVPLQTEGIWPTLFLVHGKLGQAHVGPQFLQMLGGDQPVCAIQARGIDGTERPNLSIPAMAKDYLSAILAMQPSGPYFIGGLCVGSYVALAMAQLIRQEGMEVLPLLLIDPPPPPFATRESAEKAPADPVAARLHDRRAQGRGHVADPKIQRAATGRFRVAMAFEHALAQMQPQPFDGEAYMLTSAQRLSPAGWGDRAKLDSFFSGRLHILENSTKHDLIIDVQDRTFTGHLASYLRDVHALITAKKNGRSAGL